MIYCSQLLHQLPSLLEQEQLAADGQEWKVRLSGTWRPLEQSRLIAPATPTGTQTLTGGHSSSSSSSCFSSSFFSFFVSMFVVIPHRSCIGCPIGQSKISGHRLECQTGLVSQPTGRASTTIPGRREAGGFQVGPTYSISVIEFALGLPVGTHSIAQWSRLAGWLAGHFSWPLLWLPWAPQIITTYIFVANITSRRGSTASELLLSSARSSGYINNFARLASISRDPFTKPFH